jgi:hypothetical protein
MWGRESSQESLWFGFKVLETFEGGHRPASLHAHLPAVYAIRTVLAALPFASYREIF